VSFRSLVVLPLATSPSPTPSLSQSTPTSPLPGENDSTWLGPGLLGFLSLMFLVVAVFFIYRSLTKQLGRVTFDEAAVNHDAVSDAEGLAPDASTVPAAEPAADDAGPAPTG
jgi:hypothetical protein